MTGCHCLDLGVNYLNKLQCRHTQFGGGGGGVPGRVSRTMGRARPVTSPSEV